MPKVYVITWEKSPYTEVTRTLTPFFYFFNSGGPSSDHWWWHQTHRQRWHEGQRGGLDDLGQRLGRSHDIGSDADRKSPGESTHSTRHSRRQSPQTTKCPLMLSSTWTSSVLKLVSRRLLCQTGGGRFSLKSAQLRRWCHGGSAQAGEYQHSQPLCVERSVFLAILCVALPLWHCSQFPRTLCCSIHPSFNRFDLMGSANLCFDLRGTFGSHKMLND